MNTPTLTSSIIVNVKVLQMEELLISIIYIAWQKVVYKNKCLKHLLEGAKIFFWNVHTKILWPFFFLGAENIFSFIIRIIFVTFIAQENFKVV